MQDKELITIYGGATPSGALLNSIVKIVTTFLDLGRVIGSAIRYAITGKKCN